MLLCLSHFIIFSISTLLYNTFTYNINMSYVSMYYEILNSYNVYYILYDIYDIYVNIMFNYKHICFKYTYI